MLIQITLTRYRHPIGVLHTIVGPPFGCLTGNCSDIYTDVDTEDNIASLEITLTPLGHLWDTFGQITWLWHKRT